MNQRGAHNPFGGASMSVDKRLGNSFPIVEAVYRQLQHIKYLAENLNELRPKDIELQENVANKTLDWRYIEKDGTKGPWQVLLPLIDITGQSPEMRVSADARIQWKYTNEPDSAWRNIFDLSGYLDQIADNKNRLDNLKASEVKFTPYDWTKKTNVQEAFEEVVSKINFNAALRNNAGILLTDPAIGAIGDGIADDSDKIQKALDTYDVVLVPVTAKGFRTTKQLNVRRAVTVIGYGCNPIATHSATAGNTIGRGSWFFFDHDGVGFDMRPNPGEVLNSVSFFHIGTYRRRDEPLIAGYQARVTDFDFYFLNTSQTTMDTICVWNPSKAIGVTGSASGRHTFIRIYGQPLNVGILIEESYDVDYLQDIHFWPYWALVDPVIKYMNTNLVALTTGRADGIRIVNFFSISQLYGWYMIHLPGKGSTYKFKAVNVEFDNGMCGIHVDPAVGKEAGINAAYGAFTNCAMQGESGSSFASIWLRGNSCQFSFDGLNIDNAGTSNVACDGSGNQLRISKFRGNWFNRKNTGNAGFFDATGSNKLYISDNWEMYDDHGANHFSWNGGLNLPDEVGMVTATTDASGRLTVATKRKGLTPFYATANMVGLTTAIVLVNSVANGQVTFQVMDPKAGAAIANTNVQLFYKLHFVSITE